MLSAKLTYAISIYQQYMKDLGARRAYDTAMAVSKLTRDERTEFRRLIYEADQEQIKQARQRAPGR